KVLMNALYGINGQQGTPIPSLSDMTNTSLAEIEDRLGVYEAIAKKYERKTNPDEKKCGQLYASGAECVRKTRQCFLSLESLLGRGSKKSDNSTTFSNLFQKTKEIKVESKESISEKASLLKRQLSTLGQYERKIRSQIFPYREKGGYWHFWPLGALICHLGREYINATKMLVTNTFPGTTSKYGDTDSLVFAIETLNRNQFNSQRDYEIAVYQASEKIVDAINHHWKDRACKRGCMIMELEAIYRVLVLGAAKKYYFGLKLNISPIKNEEGQIIDYEIRVGDLKISGLEMK